MTRGSFYTPVPRHWLLIVLVCLALLTSCASAPTYADLKATAASSGCWPGNAPTPPAVTVTPARPGPTSTVLPGTPTATQFPTTTPYPRCTPVPGAPTLVPWPTALPTPVPHPTLEPEPILGGSDMRTLMQLPGIVHHLDIAVHPSQGWPAVITTQHGWQGWDDADHRRIYVQVYNPRAKMWGQAQQVNLPPEDGNANYGGAAIAITGDGVVHVAWGGAFTPGKPVYYTNSSDYGRTWSTPTQIGHDCYHVQDMAATSDGQIVVLALCTPVEGDFKVWPGLIQRKADETWLPPAEFPHVDGRWGSLVLTGEGAEARAVAMFTHHGYQDANIIQKQLIADQWQIQRTSVAPPAGTVNPDGTYYLNRGIAFRRPNGEFGVIFTWSVYGGNAIFAITSLDGGRTWGPVETVVAHAAGTEGNSPPPLDSRWSTPAYDVLSDRLIVVWVGRDVTTPYPQAATHYASWSVPGSRTWSPAQLPGNYQPLIPLVSGAERASTTASAQTGNASYFWLTWIDAMQIIKVRSVDMNLIIPVDQYPVATPRPTLGDP